MFISCSLVVDLIRESTLHLMVFLCLSTLQFERWLPLQKPWERSISNINIPDSRSRHLNTSTSTHLTHIVFQHHPILRLHMACFLCISHNVHDDALRFLLFCTLQPFQHCLLPLRFLHVWQCWDARRLPWLWDERDVLGRVWRHGSWHCGHV